MNLFLILLIPIGGLLLAGILMQFTGRTTLKGYDIGSAKYDAIYFENLSKVLIILGHINNTLDFEKNDLVYSSSH